jgi:hypothetical protein
MANPIIRIKRGSTAPVSLSSGELAIDLTNKNLFVGKADGSVLAIGGEGTFATKSYADAAVSTANTALTAAIAAEEAARIAADSTLTSDLATEVSRATAAEGVIAANLAQELLDRASADTALDGKITTEKNRIDAILAAADADKDSFAEIVSLINSVDTENDTAFAGYVTSNNAALAAETSARQSADTTLQGNIDTVSSDLSALTSRVTTAESDILAEETARIAAVSAEQTARESAVSTLEAADDTLQDNIDAEASTRATADTSLSNRITTLENASADSRLDDVEADVADHETRITALETTIDGGVY